MTGQEFANVPENAEFFRHVAEREVGIERRKIYLAGNFAVLDENFQLRAENEIPFAGEAVKKRLFADAVAGDKEAFVGEIVNREREHSAQMFHAVDAEFF